MKKILFTLAALSLTSFSFAQEFDFGGSDSSDFGGSIEESSAPAVTISGEVGAEARAWIGTTDTVKLEDGKTTDIYNSTGYDGFYDVSKTSLDASAHANVELNYAGDYTDANIKFKLNPSTLKTYHEDIIDELSFGGSFKEGKFQLRAGKMKEVWGKGDKVHVLDNFNANDYTDFIFPDYIDRRISEVMFKATANLSWDYNIKLEGIFTPWMTADRFADSGKLVPASQTNLTNNVKSILKAQGAALVSTSITTTTEKTNIGGQDVLTGVKTTADGESLVQAIMGLSEFSTDKLYEDNIRSLKYAQAGLRLTGTFGGIDWGASYYYGHYKQPSAKLHGLISMNAYANAAKKYAAGAQEAATEAEKYQALAEAETNATLKAQYAAAAKQYATGAATAKATAEALATSAQAALGGEVNSLLSLNYDQMQVFGLEAAFVLWKFNTRWEVAYNLTEDTAGDNPWIKNNSVSWVAGFDIDIPIHNLNLNVQDNGNFILKSDKIKNGGIKVAGIGDLTWDTLGANYDTDYKSDGKYYSNKLIVLLSDKWMNEKLTTEVQGIWGIERNEFMVAPKIEYNVTEGLTFAVRGVYLYSNNEDGEFYQFTADSENHDKAFVQLTAKYQF